MFACIHRSLSNYEITKIHELFWGFKNLQCLVLMALNEAGLFMNNEVRAIHRLFRWWLLNVLLAELL